MLKDEDNAYADKAGAKVTPEIFVLDKESKVAYHGAFDDRRDPERKPKTLFTRDAIDAVLKGAVDAARSPIWLSINIPQFAY